MQLKTIVVPTDFSAYAEQAFTWALGLATDHKAKIVLMHAVPPTTYFAFPETMYLTDFAKLEEEVMADARNRLVDFVARKGTPGATVETRVVVGEAVWEICQVATQEQAELIVMGSHGRTGLSHVLLGSVAERVVRHAPCPVLVVRLPQATK